MIWLFSSENCKACDRAETLLFAMDAEYRLIKVEDYPNLAMQFNIMSVPTLIKFNSNNEITAKIVGFDKSKINKILKE